MHQRDLVRLQIELLKAQRTICDLSIELHTRDLAALELAAAPSVIEPTENEVPAA